MRRVFEIAAGVASIAGGIALAYSIRGWLYPLPLVILLSVALVGCIAFRVRDRRQPPNNDQRRLDQIFAALPREAIRRIQYEDFAVAWPADLLHPVRVFYNELGDVEHQFQSKKVEHARQRLYEAAGRFIHDEAMKAVMAPDSDRRWIGIPSGELDVAPPDERRGYEERQQSIHGAAADFVAAHDALVRVARKRGLDLHALDSDVPRPSWTGQSPVSPSPVRARWPGE